MCLTRLVVSCHHRAGQLPQNECQIKHAKSSLTEFDPADELYTVMFQAKQEDVSSSFVRDMKDLPEPEVILASDYQLDDLVRFGRDSSEHCLFTIDPTFSLGKFGNPDYIQLEGMHWTNSHSLQKRIFNVPVFCFKPGRDLRNVCVWHRWWRSFS